MNALYNLARVATATTGTGTITLGAAITGFLTFAQAGVPDAAVVTYAIADGSNSEIGRGTYTLSGTTLSRDTVYRSTGAANTGKITLSGTAQVFITPAAEDLTGAVIGPASAVDSRIAAFDGTTGKLLKDGGILTSALLVSGGALGTPASGTATNLTGLPVGTGISGLGAGVATFLATPGSAAISISTSGTIKTTNTTLTTSPTTGAAVITGGLGVGGAIVSGLGIYVQVASGDASINLTTAFPVTWQPYSSGADGKFYIRDVTNAKFPFTLNANATASYTIGANHTFTAGNVILATAGKGLQLQSGTGARAGDATLVAGTVTVTNTTVTANKKVLLSRKTIGGTVGNMSYTLSAGASFTINSSSGTDTSVITYMLVELN